MRSEGQLLLRRNARGEWWEGLWDLPRVDLSVHESLTLALADLDPQQGRGVKSKQLAPQLLIKALTPQLRSSATAAFKQRYAVPISPERYLFKLKHAVTRYRITLYCFSAPEPPGQSLPADWQYYPPDALPPLTAPTSKVLERLRVEGQVSAI